MVIEAIGLITSELGHFSTDNGTETSAAEIRVRRFCSSSRPPLFVRSIYLLEATLEEEFLPFLAGDFMSGLSFWCLFTGDLAGLGCLLPLVGV